jgi:superfamily II DNA helicase RecQ
VFLKYEIDMRKKIKSYFRGTSNKSNMAAFRETYANLHEMRSLAPKVKIIAVTATATASTRKTIMDVLLIKNPYVISESPFKQNIAYSVQ